MPRQSSITEDLIREVAERRARGEPWKGIERALRERGVTWGRVSWWRALKDVSKRHAACPDAEASCTQA